MAKAGSLEGFGWLVADLKNAKGSEMEAVIEEMGKYDVVIQSTLREVFLDHITKLRPKLKLVG